LLISPDTSFIHLAACYNIPVVVFYRLKIDHIRFPAYSEIQQILISPNGDNNAILPAQVGEAFLRIQKEIEKNKKI
jgi:ADP-heptose:LPS heptosyltransferase